MNNEFTHAKDAASVTGSTGGGVTSNAGAKGKYTLTCISATGQVKWVAEAENLVVNAGLKDMNDKYFSGVGYTATWYLGMYGPAATNDPAAADTMASHAGWTEVTGYSQATRPACTFDAATLADPSIISNTGSPAVYSVNATITVGGAFLTSDNTKGGATGVLFSAVDFDAPGDRSAISGDTLNLTYQFTLDAL